MAWGSNWGGSSGRSGNYQNYSTSLEGVGEDTFISEMLAESGKFNQDFFVMKIMSKAIDCIATDTGKFIMLVDILERSLIQSQRLDQEYIDAAKTANDEFMKNNPEPNDMQKKLSWKEEKAGIMFSLIFGRLSKSQPYEIIGELNPQKFSAKKLAEEKRMQFINDMPDDTKAAYNEYMRLKMRDRNHAKKAEEKAAAKKPEKKSDDERNAAIDSDMDEQAAEDAENSE